MTELECIKKSYNGEPVLRGVSIKIEDGEFISVMGESGSGKSTLLGIAGGFIPPDGGRVLWNGRDISSLSAADTARFRCTEMGFVFQSFRLISTLTARENILLPAMLAGQDVKKVREYMLFICGELGIDGIRRSEIGDIIKQDSGLHYVVVSHSGRPENGTDILEGLPCLVLYLFRHGPVRRDYRYLAGNIKSPVHFYGL